MAHGSEYRALAPCPPGTKNVGPKLFAGPIESNRSTKHYSSTLLEDVLERNFARVPSGDRRPR
jgi:hypothetical protein